MSIDPENQSVDSSNTENVPAHPPMTNSGKTSENSAQLIQRQVSMFSGPLPPPEAMVAYKDIQADFPERIFAMAERENAHRHEQERLALEADMQDAIAQRTETRWGQILGFLISMVAIISSGVIISVVPNIPGAAVASFLGLGGVGSLIYAFRYTRTHEATPEK